MATIRTGSRVYITEPCVRYGTVTGRGQDWMGPYLIVVFADGERHTYHASEVHAATAVTLGPSLPITAKFSARLAEKYAAFEDDRHRAEDWDARHPGEAGE
jgi:hypothetical protein